MILWDAVDGRQVTTELEHVAKYAWIFWHVRVKIARPFPKTSFPRISRSIDIGKVEMAIVAITLVFDEVDIDINAVGPHDGRASLKLFPCAVAGWDCAFLIFAAKSVIVELIVSARE